MELDIRAALRSSLIDYPGKIAMVLFLNRCNFRCPFCHNPELAKGTASEKQIPPKEILSYLESREKWLDGVCITGGEPTLHEGLPEFCGMVKGKGFLVKLDTNGTNPRMLKELIENRLVDYLAMDIKSSPESYGAAAGVKADLAAIGESISLIRGSGIPHEFRTTVVPGLFDAKTAEKIGKWLDGSEKYVLQQFNPNSLLLDDKYMEKQPYSPDELENFREIISKYVKACEIR